MKTRDRTSATQLGMLAGAALLAPLAVRVALIVEQGVSFHTVDLHGFFADAVVSLVVLLALLLACRWTRWAAMVLVFLWCAINYANYEHVMALGSLGNVTQAHYLLDPTFFEGSVLASTNLLLMVGILGGSFVLVWLGSRVKVPRAVLVGVGAAAVVGLAILLFWQPNDDALVWRQANVVYENLRWMARPSARSALDAGDGQVSERVNAQVEALYRGDLSGTPIVELGHRGTNVLLILLEGISGAQLDSIAQRYGVASSAQMPYLDKIARDNVSFSCFISHQRQTNRGEYAILCGDFPKLIVGEPKMTELLDQETLIALPAILREAGYETVYLQSAPLGFMSKDRFMPKIGFSQVYGEPWFDDAYAKNQWGIDDAAYFEQSLDKIRQLQAGEKPWFLTMLTVGTHHPYIVPGWYGDRTFASAAAYLDEACVDFLNHLRDMGVLEDTLVLITSDESVGISGYRGAKQEGAGEGLDGLTKKLSQCWSFLIAMLPTKERMQTDGEFMHTDLALSILDYLGLAAESESFAGRSVFRSYDERRPIVFANLYQRWLGMLDASGELTICSEDFQTCSTYHLPDGRLFSTYHVKRRTDPYAVEFLKAMVARSELAERRRRVFPLLADSKVPVDSKSQMQVISGGQNLTVPANMRVDVDLEFEVLGESGRVGVGHMLKSDVRNYHFQKSVAPLQPGDLVAIRYSYTTTSALQYLDCITTARLLSGDGLTLHFKTAQLELVPLDEAEAEAEAALGLQVREMKLTRPSPE